MKWLFDLIDHLIKLGQTQYEWLLHLLQRVTAGEDVADVLVTKEGAFMVFWPLTEQAKTACAEDLKTFPNQWGGYQIPDEGVGDDATWKLCYDRLNNERGLIMAWPMVIGRSKVTFVEINT